MTTVKNVSPCLPGSEETPLAVLFCPATKPQSYSGYNDIKERNRVFFLKKWPKMIMRHAIDRLTIAAL